MSTVQLLHVSCTLLYLLASSSSIFMHRPRSHPSFSPQYIQIHSQMKIQCDVCNKDEASLFCSADEAALCVACDHRVHHANKLAGKHQRFSLLQSSPKTFPLCDICQEKSAFLFCQQDRAILCRDCDISIHKVNELTKNHHRFLLTGVKLSPTATFYSPVPSSSSAASHTELVHPNNPLSEQICTANSSTVSSDNERLGFKNNQGNLIDGGGDKNGSISSISEYLIDTLPGWHVEDFLDASSTPFGLYKVDENDGLPFWDGDLEGNNIGSLSSENMGLWVPQAPPLLQSSQTYPASIMASSGMINFKEAKEPVNNKMIKSSSRKWRDDGGFTVPQISPSSIASKRTRTLY